MTADSVSRSVSWTVISYLRRDSKELIKCRIKQTVGSRTVRQSPGNVFSRDSEANELRREREEKYEHRGLIFVYQTYFDRLLKWSTNLRNLLIVELPTLEGFRSGEVVAVEVEDVDFEHGDLMVHDSKTGKDVPVPLDTLVAEHFSRLFAELKLTSGLAFKRLGNRGRKSKHEALNTFTVETVWAKGCNAVGIPLMSPRVGRAYFSVKWCMGPHKKSMKGLQAILRHDSLLSTQKYLDRIVDYPSVKAEFYQGSEGPFRSECSRRDDCPLSSSNCHCRMFTPKLEEYQ